MHTALGILVIFALMVIAIVSEQGRQAIGVGLLFGIALIAALSVHGQVRLWIYRWRNLR